MATAKPALIGIDIGASDSYVACVGKSLVDIVQNDISKRNTSTLVGFTDRERLLGDAAVAQMKSNFKNTCRNFKHVLGRKFDDADRHQEQFWSLAEMVRMPDGDIGFDVSFKGVRRQFDATQVAAMYMTKLKDLAEKWCEGKVSDAVIACPAGFADAQRQALLDAAKIAGLGVPRLMNEHTATALAYGLYRSNEFDERDPMTVAFCSAGHTVFSVALVQFVRGKLRVLAERSAKVGGRDIDELLMKRFAAEFKGKCAQDPLSSARAAFKLEEAVSKTKKVLSSNADAGCSVECLMEGEDLSSAITRDVFEKMCEPVMQRFRDVLESAKQASGVSLKEVHSVELVGGSSRVPWVKKICANAFPGVEVSTTMNQEESVARGCALQAAMLSPQYKVRDFEVEDTTPFGINVCWASQGAGPKQQGDVGDVGGPATGDCAVKRQEVFKAGSLMNVLKVLTFRRRGPFDVWGEYSGGSRHVSPVTSKPLGCYTVNLPAQAELKRVKVRAKLTLHGTFLIEGAQLIEEEKESRESGGPAGDEGEEETEEVANERQPVLPVEADADGKAGPIGNSEDVADPPEVEKGRPRVEVVSPKRRTRRTDLNVKYSGDLGLSQEVLECRMAEESAMQADMRRTMEIDEARNDLESYILTTRSRVRQGGEWGEFIDAGERDKFICDLMAAEEWLSENPESGKAECVEKLDHLKATGDPVQRRHTEFGVRDEWVLALRGAVKHCREAAIKSAGQEPDEILTACLETEQWLEEMTTKQAAIPKHAEPILLAAEMEKKNLELGNLVEICQKPKRTPSKREAKKQMPSPVR